MDFRILASLSQSEKDSLGDLELAHLTDLQSLRELSGEYLDSDAKVRYVEWQKSAAIYKNAVHKKMLIDREVREAKIVSSTNNEAYARALEVGRELQAATTDLD